MDSYLSVILLLSIAAIAIGDEDLAQKCRQLPQRLKQCCKNEILKKPMPDEMKECRQLAKPFPSCELDTCLAKKFGGLNDDGTVDKKKILESYNKFYGVDPISNDAIVSNCINGDLSNYGQEDFCELLKMKICFETQLVQTCPEWSNDGECEGAEEDLTACLKSSQ